MAIYHHKRFNVGITIALALIGAYYLWAAVGSSVCATTGIVQQTRTTWAPVTGCVIDPVEQPWNRLETH